MQYKLVHQPVNFGSLSNQNLGQINVLIIFQLMNGKYTSLINYFILKLWLMMSLKRMLRNIYHGMLIIAMFVIVKRRLRIV